MSIEYPSIVDEFERSFNSSLTHDCHFESSLTSSTHDVLPELLFDDFEPMSPPISYDDNNAVPNTSTSFNDGLSQYDNVDTLSYDDQRLECSPNIDDDDDDDDDDDFVNHELDDKSALQTATNNDAFQSTNASSSAMKTDYLTGIHLGITLRHLEHETIRWRENDSSIKQSRSGANAVCHTTRELLALKSDLDISTSIVDNDDNDEVLILNQSVVANKPHCSSMAT